MTIPFLIFFASPFSYLPEPAIVACLLGVLLLAAYEYAAEQGLVPAIVAPFRQLSQAFVPTGGSTPPVNQRNSVFLAGLRRCVVALITPLLEKNVLKTATLDVPVVFSMSRLIVLAFGLGLTRQLWSAGIAGWPEATLAIAVVLAIPTLGAIDRCAPEQVLDLSKTLLNRFGVGVTRQIASAYAETREPRRTDDHRED